MTARRALLLAGAALATGLARAQPSRRVYRVATVSVGSTRDTPFFRAMELRFRELGYLEGKNFILDLRVLGGQWDKLPAMAAEFARERPDVAIAAGSELVLKAFRQALGETPIVMIAVDYDPVDKNYIASLARPGGNITGVYLRQLESAAKRLELLKETLPGVSRVAVLFDVSTRDQFQAAQQVASKLGITLLSHELRGSSYDFDGALAAAASARAQAVLALSSGAFFVPREKWIGEAHRHRLPVIANANYGDAGALIAFGASFPHMYARAAEYADRIMKGAKPAEMPIEQPTQYDLIVNMKSAQLLGIAVPQQVVFRATRVIN